MNPSRHQEVEKVFVAAMELPAAARASFVAARCAEDPELREEVESLLGHASQHEGPLDSPLLVAPPGERGRPAPDDERFELPPDGLIGSYRAIRFLGAGGMGVVYLAEQDRPRRTVALKVIRGATATPALVRRFQHEAEVLGRLHHPGIAQIYEAGTANSPSGPWSYLAMELVDGPTITDFASSRGLDARDRLELMARVCEAIHHAHQRGVIHRDLKPSNILVDPHGQPKILDFGVARATDADIQLTTLRTSVGQLIGTLPYMSPEQVAADPSEIDNRSDVYALGVLTFELLAGRPPHDLRSRSIPEAARIIRDDPPTRLSSIDRGLRGEVETIVGKAMAKDKQQRYQSAAELAEDLRRHLAGEPIVARDATAAERLRRKLRRYQQAAAGSFLLILLLAALAGYALIQSIHNKALASSEQAARSEEELSRQATTRLNDQLTQLNGQLTEELRTGLIERGRVEGVAKNGPGAEAILWPELFRDPDSRQVYWALWELSSRFPCRWTTLTNDDSPTACAASPDATLVLAGTASGQVMAVAADTGEVLGTFGVTPPTPAARVVAMRFIDGQTVVTAHADGWARRWWVQPDHYDAIDSWKVSEARLVAAAFSGEASLLAVAGTDNIVSAWSTGTAERVCNLAMAGGGATAVAVHAETSAIAVGTRDGQISVFDLAPGRQPRTVGSRPELYRSLAFSPDGKTLYSAANNGVMASWSLTADPSVRLQHGESDARRVVPHPSGRFVLTLRNLGLTVDDIGEDQQELVGFPISAFADAVWVGDRVLTAEPDGLRLWDAHAWPARAELGSHMNWVFGVAFSSVGDRVVSASGDGTIAVRSVPDGRLIVALRLPDHLRSRTAVFTGDGATVAAGCSDGLIRLFDAATGEERGTLGPVGAEIYGLALHPNGTQAAAVSINGVLSVFDLQLNELSARRAELDANAKGVAYSPDGARIYTSGDPRGVVVWDARTLERLDLIPTSAAPWAVALNPDGTLLAAGTYDATVELVDLRTGKHATCSGRHNQVVAGLAFAPDGQILASGGDDGTVKLWDPQSHRLLASLEPGQGQVASLAFHPAGRWLACATAGGRVQLWDLNFHSLYLASNLRASARRFGGESVSADTLQQLHRRLAP